jgi:hypothetical protein
LLGLFPMVIICSFSAWYSMSSVSILASSIIPRFCNLFVYLIGYSTTLNLSIPLMLPNVEFVCACLIFELPKLNPYQNHSSWQCTCYANICKP